MKCQESATVKFLHLLEKNKKSWTRASVSEKKQAPFLMGGM